MTESHHLDSDVSWTEMIWCNTEWKWIELESESGGSRAKCSACGKLYSFIGDQGESMINEGFWESHQGKFYVNSAEISKDVHPNKIPNEY